MRKIFDRLDQTWKRWETQFLARPILGWLGLALAIIGFVAGGVIAARTVNLDSEDGDQNAYIRYSEDLRESDFSYVGDRNRMPLYPGLQALFYKEGTPRPEIFERGKMVNIGLALVGLALLTAVMWRYVSAWGVFLFTGGLAMGLFMPKAGYFQAEILYYTLFTLFFIGGAYLMHRPSWWAALAVGGIAALTHWTKASILPGVALLSFALGLRMLYAGWRFLRKRPDALRTAVQCGLAMVLLPGAYVAGIAPYLIKSGEQYEGHYFHNVNSSFYIWLDSWDEAKAFSKKADDRHGWPQLPEEEIPSAGKYFSEKSPGEIAGRLFGGMYHQHKLMKGYGAWKFILPVVLVLLWQWWHAGRAGVEPWLRKYCWTLFFALMFFGAYFSLISFYSAIADGARFIFALYGPSLAAVLWMSENFAASERKRLGTTGPATTPQTWVFRLVTVLIVLELPLKLILFMPKEYCGS